MPLNPFRNDRGAIVSPFSHFSKRPKYPVTGSGCLPVVLAGNIRLFCRQ
jgi:hypothetical protein